MIAFVLIGLQECDEREILDKLLSYKEIIEAHILFGEWDIIAKIEADDPEKAGSFVLETIRTIPEVNITSTLIVAK